MTTAPAEARLITAEEHERLMAEFRAKVRKEALHMADEHDLCSVVEDTLTRIGIGTQYQTLTITTTVTRTLIYTVPSDLIAGFPDEAAMKTAFEKWHTGDATSQEDRMWRGITEVSDIEEMAVDSMKVGPLEPVGVKWLYMWDGRVAHAVVGRHAKCGRFNQYWRITTSRGPTDARCQQCVKALAD